ncbi:unnamed protein product [Owenia fusiformis]|uniref:Uncharacterized protein n=1 Tax=Owenia fusiformis TaxID=6347 RepID=A0A8S4QB01_OWEFU|nr:unnamed protein product [Owenia fusiformis]
MGCSLSKSHNTKRLTKFINLTANTVDIRNVYAESQLEEHTSFVENLVKDILENVGKIEPALATDGLINRGSYYDRTKILHPDEYDYHPILGLSQYVTDVTNASDSHEDDGKRKIRINVNKLPYPLPSECLENINENDGEADLRTEELLNMLLNTISAVLKEMETRKSVKFYWSQNYRRSYKKEIDNVVIHGPSALLIRVGAPLGITDIDLCFCLKWKPHELGPSVHIIDRKNSWDIWLESVVELPNSDKYVLTPPHRKLFLTLKYLSNLTRLLGIVWQISSHVLKTLILNHQQKCRASSLGECLISIINELIVKPDDEHNPCDIPDDEYNCDEDFLYLFYSNLLIPNPIFPGEPQRLSPNDRIPMLISMVWIVQHIKLNRSNNWWNAFLSNNLIGVRRNRILQSLMDGLHEYYLLATSKSHGRYVKLEWQHDAKKSIVLIDCINPNYFDRPFRKV